MANNTRLADLLLWDPQIDALAKAIPYEEARTFGTAIGLEVAALNNFHSKHGESTAFSRAVLVKWFPKREATVQEFKTLMGPICYQAVLVMDRILNGEYVPPSVGKQPIVQGVSKSTASEAPDGPKAIYGKDQRQHIKQAPPEHQKASTCVVSLWQKRDIIEENDQVCLLTKPYTTALHNGVERRLASTVPFRTEPVAAIGSGFFYHHKGNDYVITARHCIMTSNCGLPEEKVNPQVTDQEKKYFCPIPTNLNSIYFVFGWTDTKMEVVSKENVFTGELALVGFESDFAIIKLNKSLAGKAVPQDRFISATIRKESAKLPVDQELYMVGHPCGMSMIYAANAKVLGISQRQGLTFETNLTSFAGNSGSPVFDKKTNQVEGILVAGQRDYKLLDNGVLEEMIYEEFPDRGETCVRINIQPIRNFFS